MPLILNIGHSRKVGEPNYGSRGASVNLQMEVEASVVREPEELQRKIKYLFGLAKTCVDEELAVNARQSKDRLSADGQLLANRSVNGSPSGVRSATKGQIRALHAISRQQRIDLTEELRRRFDMDRPDRLSVSQASELIDAMKPKATSEP